MKIVCDDCGWQGEGGQELIWHFVESPDTTIQICPRCQSWDGFLRACDEPECWGIVVAGTPTHDGYRSTCHKHIPKP